MQKFEPAKGYTLVGLSGELASYIVASAYFVSLHYRVQNWVKLATFKISYLK